VWDFKRLIAIGCLAISTAWAEKPFDYQVNPEAVQQAQHAADIARKNAAGAAAIQDVQSVVDVVRSPEYQARLEEYRASISRVLGVDFTPSLSSDEQTDPDVKKEQSLNKNGRLYVFVSSAMQEDALRRKVKEVSTLPNAVLVLNGFIGGAKKIKPTISLIANLLKKDSSCEGVNCDLYAVEVNIDPLRFSRYGITRVPAVVYEPDEQFLGYCDGDALKTPSDRLVVYGESSLQYALEAMHQEQPAEGLLEIIAHLEPIPWESRHHNGP